MDSSPRQLESLTRNPREELGVELKGWLDLSQGEHRADLAKALMALTNHGGGYVLLGYGKWLRPGYCQRHSAPLRRPPDSRPSRESLGQEWQ
jgi:hypothetical protein